MLSEGKSWGEGQLPGREHPETGSGPEVSSLCTSVTYSRGSKYD